MAASMNGLYDKWLEEKLISINPDVDTDVFVSYISGIVDSDSSPEDKKESIIGIIEGIIEENADIVCEEILKRWDESIEQSRLNEVKENIDAKLSRIMITESAENRIQEAPTTMSAEELARKQAILSQYAQDDFIDESLSGAAADSGRVGGGDGNIERNINSETVSHEDRAKREKSKQDHLRKKEKDKSDREAQKQKQVDRKDAEKKRTQKGEKRR